MGRPRSRRHDRPRQEGLSQEDIARLSRGFLDAAGLPRKECIVEDADYFGEMFAKRARVTRNQMRNFYQETRRIWELVSPPGTPDESKMEKNFTTNHPLLLMVMAKANYGVGRESNKLPTPFRDYLVESIKKVNSAKEFSAFMKSFEAMVGYFYSNDPRA